MSSILDALNKLEQEKVQSRRERDGAPHDPVSAAHDLVGRSLLRDRVTVRISPATLIVSGAALLTLILAIALVIAISLGGSDTPEVTASAASPASTATAALEVPPPGQSASPFVRLPDPQPMPMPSQVQSAPPSAAPSAPQSAMPEPDASATQLTAPPPPTQSPQQASPAPAKSQKPEPAPPQPEPARVQAQPATEPKPAPEPPAREPAEEATAPTRVARTTDGISSRADRSLPAAEAPTTRVARDEDLSTLPILTDSDVRRFGLLQLKINMPSPAGPTNPQGSAILTLREEADDGSVIANTMKFYEGQRIQTTTLRLFKVERNAVGVEDMRSGDRYQLRF